MPKFGRMFWQENRYLYDFRESLYQKLHLLQCDEKAAGGS